MKKTVFSLIAILMTFTLWAQSPDKLNYQAVIRNSSGQLISNRQVGMQISILQGSATGPAVYVETQTPASNANGLINIEIGGGTVVSGDFQAIDWSAGPYFLQVETDPEGGVNYTLSGTSQLLSVPYALHTRTADSLTGGVTEADPLFGASVASNITGPDTSHWNTAYGWGDHAAAGYDPTPDSWKGDSLTWSKENIGIKVPPSALNLQIGKPHDNFFTNSFGGIDTSMDRTLYIGGLWDSHQHSQSILYLAGQWVDSNQVTGSLTFVSGAWDNAAIQGREGSATDWSGELVFLTRKDNNPMAEQMRITQDGNVGIGTAEPAVKLDVNGNAHIAGDLTVDGTLSANIHIDSVDVSQITGLLGQGYTLAFPDIVDNYTTINIGRIGSDHAVILHGPGYDIEKIEMYDGNGNLYYLPGESMEHPIIFEVDNSDPAFLSSLKAWFDQNNPDPDSVTIIIKNNAGDESIHWNSYHFKPDGYEQGVDNRTRFTLVNASLPDHVADYSLVGDPFGSENSINPETDPEEMLFDGEKLHYPAFSEDTTNHILTITWDFIEAHNVWPFFLPYVKGNGNIFQIIVAFHNDQGNITIWTYDSCTPVKIEQTTGFGLDLKTKLQVKIWYVRKRIA